MSQQENINNLMSKMAEALQMVKECEALVLEEIKQIEQLQEEKGRLAGEIAALSKELSLIQNDIEKTKVSKASEIVDKEEDVAEITTSIPEAVAPTPVAETPTVVQEKHNIETLADKFHGQPSLNDKIAAKSDITTTGARVNDLAKAISINDRLLFIKELFGNSELFTQTVRLLNGLQSFDEAQQYLAETFPHWDNDNSATQLLMAIIRRRYS